MRVRVPVRRRGCLAVYQGRAAPAAAHARTTGRRYGLYRLGLLIPSRNPHQNRMPLRRLPPAHHHAPPSPWRRHRAGHVSASPSEGVHEMESGMSSTNYILSLLKPKINFYHPFLMERMILTLLKFTRITLPV